MTKWNKEMVRSLIQQHCPDQIAVIDNISVTSFFEELSIAFEKLHDEKLEEKYTAKELFWGIDFCYLHPLVFWVRTSFSFAKRYEGELWADFYYDKGKFHFDACKGKSKTWPMEALDSRETFCAEVIQKFEKLFGKHSAKKTWA